jgi:hypothetical protein
MSDDAAVHMAASENNIVEDCTFTNCKEAVAWDVLNSLGNTVRRCLIMFMDSHGIENWNSSLQAGNPDHLVENCIIGAIGAWGGCISNTNGGGVTVRNCLIFGGYRGVMVSATGVTPVTVVGSIITASRDALLGTAVGDVVENYNTLWGNATDRTNTDTGANSVSYPALLQVPILNSGSLQASGYGFPGVTWALSQWSQIAAIGSVSEPSVDIYGMERPGVFSKKSWGPIQYHDVERETTTVRGSSTASIKLADAARHQLWVPTDGKETTFSVYVYREADYTGTLPRLIVKQPGAADDVTVDTGSAGQWNQLTTTLTPNTSPPYVVMELVSSKRSDIGFVRLLL